MIQDVNYVTFNFFISAQTQRPAVETPQLAP